MPSLLEAITTPTGRDRGPINRGKFRAGKLADRVDPKGGDFGSGIIRGASIIARGEALGHYAWIDGIALDQVEQFGNGSKGGSKVRFTHPDMSGDGLGSFMGRAKDFVREGDQVFADIHFSESSRETPDGDLAGYLMKLATEDPESFGMSIVFDHDWQAEEQFTIDHEVADDKGRREFQSPDADNKKNYPHVRLRALYGADFVDEPAANPGGLFHKKQSPTAAILKQAETVAAYTLGLSSELPTETGGVDPARLRGFFSRFLETRGLQVHFSQKGETMPKGGKLSTDTVENTNDAASGSQDATEKPGATSTESKSPGDGGTKPEEKAETKPEEKAAASSAIDRAELSRYVANFGAEKGTKYLLDGVKFEDALSQEFQALKQKLEVGGGGERGESNAVGQYGETDNKKGNDHKASERDAASKIIRIPGRSASRN